MTNKKAIFLIAATLSLSVLGCSQAEPERDETQDYLEMTVRDCLDRVSKDNFGEFESTEWSIVFNQSSGEVRYYHRENYGNSYIFYLK